jgi:phospholipid/cholesterol/gamma-HCH transport system substrate-binding protein
VSRRRTRLTPFQIGLLAIVIIAAAAYFSFSKNIPFSGPFQLKAVFADGKNIGVRSPVRIAGVEVGKVVKVEPASGDSNATEVTIELKDNALPIHEDARLKIRPRTFLEGNYFVALSPGEPGSPTVGDGDTIPMTQTASPVLLQDVLNVFQSNTREDLQKLLEGYGGALAGKPLPGEDDDQDPAVQGETAGQALNQTLVYSPGALRGTAIVNQALLGERLHDLSKLVASGRKVAAALDSREEQLKDLITNFNITTAALASQQGNLRQTIRLLPRVLRAANPAFDSLNRSFPPTRALARELLPGVRETGPTIDAAFPWIAQTRKLVSPAELQGLVEDLSRAVPSLAKTTNATLQLLPQVDLVDRCALEVVLPTGDRVISDPPFTSGIPNYREFFQSLVGLAGEGAGFDGNSYYTRVFSGGGDVPAQTSPLPGTPQLFGNAVLNPLGTRPTRPSSRPPYRRSVPCHRNTPPDLNSARTGAGP